MSELTKAIIDSLAGEDQWELKQRLVCRVGTNVAVWLSDLGPNYCRPVVGASLADISIPKWERPLLYAAAVARRDRIIIEQIKGGTR